MTNLSSLLERAAAEHPDQPALRLDELVLTYADLRDAAGRMGALLASIGIEPGDRVGLMLPNVPAFPIAFYGALAAGVVVVPMNPLLKSREVAYYLGDSGAKAVVAWHAMAGEAAKGAADAGAQMIAAESPDLAGLIGGLTAEAGDPGRGDDDDAVILYTSGTTGRPKGCELTHGNLLADVRNVIHGSLPVIFETPGASTLLFLPLAHSFARIIQVGCLEAGVVLGHTPSTANLQGDLAAFRPTFILAVPRVFEKVYSTAEQQASASPVKGRIFYAAAQTAIDWSKAFGTSGVPRRGSTVPLRVRHALFDLLVYARLRAAVGGHVAYAVSGGAPLGERLGHFFRGAGITVLEGYGLTESSAAATVNRPERVKIGTVGQPLPGASIRIADDGEILLAGPNIFGGYWHNNAGTAEVLVDGWLRTGDMGELDEDGYLRVTGRKKELIVTAGGKNVAPAVLEDRVRVNLLVSQCMVVGDGRPYIACLITLDEEAVGVWLTRHKRPAGITIAQLAEDPEMIGDIQVAVDEANQAVSRAESIRRFRILPVDFTEQNGYLTPSLKVRRSAVMKDFAADIESLYG